MRNRLGLPLRDYAGYPMLRPATATERRGIPGTPRRSLRARRIGLGGGEEKDVHGAHGSASKVQLILADWLRDVLDPRLKL